MRTTDFKLGYVHGKVKPAKKDSEAAIQRNVFLSPNIKIVRNKNEALNTNVHLFAYEMPTGYRSKRVDLVGYDEKYNLYLIELKKGLSTESLARAINEINKYETAVKKLKKYIEADFKRTFFFSIKFKKIKKIILAPREFYKKEKASKLDKSIEYLFFRTKDITKKETGQPVSVHVVRVKK